MAIVLHLAVHLLGTAVAVGLGLLALVSPLAGPRAVPRSARSAVAVGGILLAVSHLAVGSLLAEPDGWPLLVRAAGYAALAVGAAGGLVRGLAVLAVLPPILPLAAAVAGVAASVATARGVLGRGRRVAPLAAGIAAYAVADLLVTTRPSVAAGLSLAGSVAAGTWVLRRAARRSLAGRVTGLFLVVLVALVLGLAVASGLVLTSDVQAEQRDRLTAVAASQAGDLVDRAGASLEATGVALAGTTLVEPLVAGDADLAAARIERITALPDVDLVVLTDADGSVVAATRREDPLSRAASAALAGSPPVGLALEGGLGRGVVDLGDGTLVTVGAVPVAPAGDDGRPVLLRQVGSLVLGQVVTAPTIVERIGADTVSDVAIVVGGDAVAATVTGDDAAALADAADAGSVALGGVDRVVASAPLGTPARGHLVLALPADVATATVETAIRTTFLLAVAALLLAAASATWLVRRAARPIADLTSAAERVAGGELTTRVTTERTGRDEVGRLAVAFDEMTGSLEARDRDLRRSLQVQAGLRDRLETITSSMGEALLATDAHGRVTSANRAAEVLLDRPVDRLVGAPLRTVLDGRAEGGLDLVDELASGTDAPAVVRGELEGSGRVVDVSTAPLAAAAGGAAGSATSTGRVYVLRDVTERFLADRVRTEIIANLSHELNTPLTPIKAFLEVVATRRGVDDRYVPMLDLAREGRVRLERTITALVDLAELEAGRKEVVIRPVDVDTLVGDLLERWRERVPDRRLRRRIERGLPPVLVDPSVVARVLDEIVDNAVKFAPGPVRISASAGTADDEVLIRIRDDGPGIAAAQRDEVFELFVQADGSSTRQVGGLGIGLPIANRMAHALGGVLALTDAPDGGTDVLLSLKAVTP